MANAKPAYPSVKPARKDARWDGALGANRDRLVLMPRSPRSVFAYWEWTAAKAALFAKGALAPQVSFKLIYAATGQTALEFKFGWNELCVYLEPPAEGKAYRAALQIFDSAGGLHSSVESNETAVPRGRPADGEGDIPSSWDRPGQQL